MSSHHRQNDVLGTDRSEDVKDLIKRIDDDLETDRRNRIDRPLLWTPEREIQSRYRGPWAVAIERTGRDSFFAYIVEDVPGVPLVRAWGHSARAAFDLLNGELAICLVRSGVCRELLEAARVTVESRFEVVKASDWETLKQFH